MPYKGTEYRPTWHAMPWHANQVGSQSVQTKAWGTQLTGDTVPYIALILVGVARQHPSLSQHHVDDQVSDCTIHHGKVG